MELKTDEIDKLKEDYKTQMEKEWLEDYEDDLKEINDKIDCYEGDVREGESDLEQQRDDLQKKLKEAKEGDSDLEPFTKRLDKNEYGKEDVAKLVPKEEATLLQEVIDALQERLDVLKSP